MENPFNKARAYAYATAAGGVTVLTGAGLILAADRQYGKAHTAFIEGSVESGEAASRAGDTLATLGGPVTIGGIAVMGIAAAAYLLRRPAEPKQ